MWYWNHDFGWGWVGALVMIVTMVLFWKASSRSSSFLAVLTQEPVCVAVQRPEYSGAPSTTSPCR